VPRVRPVRLVRHVRHNVPSQASPRCLTLKPPIVFMSADAGWSVLPRVRPVRPVRLVRHNVPIQQARAVLLSNRRLSLCLRMPHGRLCRVSDLSDLSDLSDTTCQFSKPTLSYSQTADCLYVCGCRMVGCAARLTCPTCPTCPTQRAKSSKPELFLFFNFDFYSFTVEVQLYTVYIIAELCSKRQRMFYGKT